MANPQPQNAALSLYFLHTNENPSLVLVKPPLIGKNYHSWSRSMRMALMSKNKLGLINGNLDAPAVGSPDYHAWEQCNNMVLSWILNSLSASIAQSVMWLNTAKEVWTDLNERFSHGDHFRLSDCGMTGHTEDRCFRKHEFPPGGRGRGRSTNGRGGGRHVAAHNVDTMDQYSYASSQSGSSYFTAEQLEEIRGFLQAPISTP